MTLLDYTFRLLSMYFTFIANTFTVDSNTLAVNMGRNLRTSTLMQNSSFR